MSQDGDSNVLFNSLFLSIWLNILIAEWLKYWACEQQIMSLNPFGAFVPIYCIIFFGNITFHPKLHIHCLYSYILLITHAFHHNQVMSC